MTRGPVDPRGWDGHVGALEPDEQTWKDQLTEQSTLGWHLIGRTPEGWLIAEAILPCGRDSAHERVCTIKRTPDGLLYDTLQRPPADQ